MYTAGLGHCLMLTGSCPLALTASQAGGQPATTTWRLGVETGWAQPVGRSGTEKSKRFGRGSSAVRITEMISPAGGKNAPAGHLPALPPPVYR